jgi:hypothetical protein
LHRGRGPRQDGVISNNLIKGHAERDRLSVNNNSRRSIGRHLPKTSIVTKSIRWNSISRLSPKSSRDADQLSSTSLAPHAMPAPWKIKSKKGTDRVKLKQFTRTCNHESRIPDTTPDKLAPDIKSNCGAEICSVNRSQLGSSEKMSPIDPRAVLALDWLVPLYNPTLAVRTFTGANPLTIVHKVTPPTGN